MQCLICRSDTNTPLYHVRNIDVERCDHCGFIAADVSAAAVDFDDLYVDRYPIAAFLPQRPRKLRKSHEELRVAEQLTAGRRLLDVGCSYGFFLDAARQRGWEVTGIELSASAAAYARKEYGLPVIDGTLEGASLPRGAYDVVSIRHVLEHAADPLALLCEARRLLAPRGVLLTAVPNIDSLAHRLVGRDWWWVDPPTHLWYFSPHTLRTLLVQARLVPVRTATSRADDHTLLYTLLFALNRRGRVMQRVHGMISGKNGPSHRGVPDAAVAGKAPWAQELWRAVGSAGEAIEAVLAPIIRVADRAELGSEVLVFARALPMEARCMPDPSVSTGTGPSAR